MAIKTYQKFTATKEVKVVKTTYQPIYDFIQGFTSYSVNNDFKFSSAGNKMSISDYNTGKFVYYNSSFAAEAWPFSGSSVLYKHIALGSGKGSKVEEIRAVDTKSTLIETIQAKEGTYPNDGMHTDGYWYVLLPNQTPTISGTDQDLGGKTGPFNYKFTVDDKDTTQELTINILLNGRSIKTISNALRNHEYYAEITDELFAELVLNQENTIEISVSDGQGATAYRRLKFRRTNSPPTISITNRELGEQNEPFSFNFTVNDLENDVVNLEFINGGKIIDTMENVTLDEEITYTFDKVTFAQLFNGNQEIVIRAIDINNAASADRVYFNKSVAGAGYIHRYQSDVLCDYVIVWDDIDLASGEEKKLQVCNNFNDENPVWEDAPFNDVHKFANTTVVNAPDVGVRIEVLADPNTGNSYINSFMVKAGVISGS